MRAKLKLRGLLVPFIILVLGLVITIVFGCGKTKPIKENFSSYADCISSGFTKQFCVQTPTSAIGPAGCICPNGNIGKIMPGLRGGCVCKDTTL